MSDDPRALIRYALVAAVVTVIVVWTLYLIRNILLLIYVAALFAIGLAPIVQKVEKGPLSRIRRIPRWLAILIIYLGVLGILVGLGAMVAPPLVQQARELWAQVPDRLHDAQQWLIDRGILSREVTIKEAVQRAPVAGGADAVGTVLAALWGVVGGVLGLLTILILTFYFLVGAEDIVSTFVQMFPRRERPRVAAASVRVSTKVSAWLAGQMLLASIIGTTAGLGLWLMGVPYFYVLALIAAIGELIPVIGPLLASIPAIGVALTVSPALALGVAVFFVAQQQVENHVLVPKVMERQVGVNAAVVITSLLIGGSLLGVVGAILAVPTAAILHVLFVEIWPDAAEDS
jgi:predicted PurR-regulated permease PerM